MKFREKLQKLSLILNVKPDSEGVGVQNGPVFRPKNSEFNLNSWVLEINVNKRECYV